MSLGVDDTGGYASGEILASESDFDGEEAGSIDAASIKKTLLRADDVLHALNKQSRKRVLPLSSDDSEPEIFDDLPLTTISSKRTKANSSSKSANSPKKNSSPPTTTSTVTGKKASSFQKTPSRNKDTESAATSLDNSSTPFAKDSRKVVDKTPKGRHSERNDGTTLAPRNGSPEDIMASLREISNTLNQVVSRMDRQECRMECMEKKLISAVHHQAAHLQLNPLLK